MAFILCVRCTLLGRPWTDLDGAFGVCGVRLKLLLGHGFNFRSEVQTGGGPEVGLCTHVADVVSTPSFALSHEETF